MRIQYKATKHRMDVRDETGRRLVANGIAIEVVDAPKPAAKAEPKPEKPKRTYKRRDLQAEPGAATEPAGHYVTRDMQSGEQADE